MAQTTLSVNGEEHEVEATGSDMLLYVLRDELLLNGPKFGCGLAQCGACTVLIDGNPARACQTPVSDVEDAKITTLDSVGTRDTPGAIQQAFIDEQAAQCGYCMNGMMMTATALLEKNPDPSDEDIRNALTANLCRCGTHTRIIRAIKRAAKKGATA